MITKEILSKYTVPQLQAIIKKTNVKGFTKLSKPEIIIEMNKPEHKSNFSLVGELSSFTLPNLKAELKRTNVAKFNTLTKSDLIDKMLLPDHISNFDELKPREAPKKRGVGKKTIEADKKYEAAKKKEEAEDEARWAVWRPWNTPTTMFSRSGPQGVGRYNYLEEFWKQQNRQFIEFYKDIYGEEDGGDFTDGDLIEIDNFIDDVYQLPKTGELYNLPGFWARSFGLMGSETTFYYWMSNRIYVINREKFKKLLEDTDDMSIENITKLVKSFWTNLALFPSAKKGYEEMLANIPKPKTASPPKPKPASPPKPKPASPPKPPKTASPPKKEVVKPKPKKEIKKTTFTPKLDGEILRWYRDTNAKYVVEIMDDEFVADDDAFEEKAQELYGDIESEITLTKKQLEIVNKKIQKQIKKVVKGIMDDDFDADEDNFIEIIDSILKWD
tara:strand:+ start:321 stop:1649 length:1329 start_codon:yes stop_codon:yes gene_type:complete